MLDPLLTLSVLPLVSSFLPAHAVSLPGGIGGGGIGYLAFVCVKLLGYCAFAAVAQKWLGKPRWPFLVVGVVRTLVGMLVGLFVFLLVQLAEHLASRSAGSESLEAGAAGANASVAGDPFLFLVGLLIAVRVGEWQFVLRLAHREAKRILIHAFTAVGILWSFVLDAIAVAAAFAVPGGFWVC